MPQSLAIHNAVRQHTKNNMAVTAVARSKACNVFARSNSGIVGSNPSRGMDVCPRFFYFCVVLCVGSGFAMS
jgi:hypothetical protein